MVWALALVFLAPNPVPPEVAQFKAAFASRRGNVAEEKADPAISKCLNLMIAATKSELRAHQNDLKKAGDRAAAMIKSVYRVDKFGNGPVVDEYGFGYVSTYRLGGCLMIVARMGAATRIVAYDMDWHNLALPPEFSWGTPWNRLPSVLPSGVILVWGDSIQVMGMRVGLRMLWLKHEGRRLRKLREFENGTTIEYVEPQIKGNRVTAYTIDNPRSFFVSASTPVFGRLTTWDCSSGRPRLIAVQLLHQPLRAIDRDAVRAYHARRPTALQRHIRKLWPAEYKYGMRNDLGTWSEKPLPGGGRRVVCDSDVVFDLGLGPRGYRVVAVRKVGRG